jgi:ABC-type lipoprotein export system ATPase subunit
VRALDGVSASLRAGRFYALVGPSGCGKTTLLHLLAGLDRPDRGTIEVLGRGLDGLSRAALAALRRDEVTFASQASALVPYLSAGENVRLGLGIRGLPESEQDRLAARVLGELRLDGVAGRHAGALSGGERQRASLARALAPDARLLIVDEPTAGLDERGSRLVARLLRDHAHRHGTTVVCATHDPAVASVADAVLRMRDGRLL